MSPIASLHRIGAKKVLEVGCGLGYYSFFMKMLIDDIKVTGIDISETAIKKARETFQGIEFRVGSTADIKSILAEGGMMLSFFQKFFGIYLTKLKLFRQC